MCGIARQAKHCMRAAIRKVSVTGNGKLNSSCHCVLQADLDAAVDAMPTAASRRTAKRHQARLEAAGQGKSCMRPRKNCKRQRDTAASHPYPSQVRLDLASLRPACDLNGPSRSKHLRTHLSCHRITGPKTNLRVFTQQVPWVASCGCSPTDALGLCVAVKEVAQKLLPTWHSFPAAMPVLCGVFCFSQGSEPAQKQQRRSHQNAKPLLSPQATTARPASPPAPPQQAHGVARQEEGPALPPAPDNFLQTEMEEARLLVRRTPLCCA